MLALEQDALNLEAALTWIPGTEAARRNSEASRGAVRDTTEGWTGAQGFVRQCVSYADYIAGLRRSGGYPGNIAEDITEPYFSRLARLEIQQGLQGQVQIEDLQLDGGCLLAKYRHGKPPTWQVKFRRCPVRFEKLSS